MSTSSRSVYTSLGRGGLYMLALALACGKGLLFGAGAMGIRGGGTEAVAGCVNGDC